MAFLFLQPLNAVSKGDTYAIVIITDIFGMIVRYSGF